MMLTVYEPKTCPNCGVELIYMNAPHCGNIRCSQALFLKSRRREGRTKGSVYDERISRAKDHLKNNPDVQSLTSENLQVAVVPHVYEPLSPLPAERRSAFLDQLQDVIKSAFDAAPLEPQEDAPAPPVARQSWCQTACTTCGGRCCAAGAETNAFLTKEHINALRLSNPSLTVQEVTEYYTAKIAAEVTEGSCVYHGAQGCTLDREWRSEICNRFLCSDLRRLARLFDPEKSPEVAFVSINGQVPERVAVYRPDGSDPNADA